MRTGIPCNENRFFPVGIGSQGVPCELYRVWVCSARLSPMAKLDMLCIPLIETANGMTYILREKQTISLSTQNMQGFSKSVVE